MAEIRELRVSFFWLEAFPLERIAASLLGDSQRYLQECAKAKIGGGSWSMPWVDKKRQHFWEYYLERQDKENVGCDGSWRHLMPLRAMQFVKVAKTSGIRWAVEGFGYPHGAAVLATAYIEQDLPLFDMVDKTIRAWKGVHRATWLKTGTAVNQSLEQIAGQGLEFLWTCLGVANRGNKPVRRAFTVATVINAREFDMEKRQESGGEIHRVLEGLCTFDPSYKTNKRLDPLEGHCLQLRRNSSDMHLLFHLRRSRALWFPYCFEELCDVYRSTRNTIHMLGCYHRNLTLAALQTESLIALIAPLSDLLGTGQEIPVTLKNLARNAGGVIGRLHGGKDTFRTYSTGIRLGEPKISEAMARVRQAI